MFRQCQVMVRLLGSMSLSILRGRRLSSPSWSPFLESGNLYAWIGRFHTCYGPGADTNGQQTPSAGMPVQISVAYGTTGLLDEAGQPAATLSTQSDAAGEVHFDMQFPLTGHADELFSGRNCCG